MFKWWRRGELPSEAVSQTENLLKIKDARSAQNATFEVFTHIIHTRRYIVQGRRCLAIDPGTHHCISVCQFEPAGLFLTARLSRTSLRRSPRRNQAAQPFATSIAMPVEFKCLCVIHATTHKIVKPVKTNRPIARSTIHKMRVIGSQYTWHKKHL